MNKVVCYNANGLFPYTMLKKDGPNKFDIYVCYEDSFPKLSSLARLSSCFLLPVFLSVTKGIDKGYRSWDPTVLFSLCK